MRYFITGGKGQLGQALQRALAGQTFLASDLPELDITNYQATLETIREFRPTVIIHGAAYTNVDGCEGNDDAAYRVNMLGTKYLALAAKEVGASMVYISTNYVFDGTASNPYREYDPTNAISVYGQSKLAGEQCLTNILDRHYIARTAWLYGEGAKNFVNTVVRLAGENNRMKMVTDEIANPTYAKDLAEAVVKLAQTEVYGTYHLTNAGYCSRFEFAQEILRTINKTDLQMDPISLDEWPRPAQPPRFAPMRNFCAAELGIVMRPWQEALREYLCVSQ
jgi:dTDP-4-dehydrorhamnose reductase